MPGIVVDHVTADMKLFRDESFGPQVAITRVASADEKPAMWEHMVQVWPDYANYQAKTDRDIPVVVLERAA